MGEIKIGCWVLGRLQTNTYLLYREGSTEVIVVDPADYGELIYQKLAEMGLRVAAIFLTHGHFDHIWGVEELRRTANEAARAEGLPAVQVYACEGERELLLDADKNVSADFGRPCTLEADVYVKDGEEITVAGVTCRVIATPGHTEGGCCYYLPTEGYLIAGDTLFLESTGRTDFPTGSMGTLVRSIRDKLFVLPDDTKVYPGHGESTTIGHEKKYNPFCV